MNAALLLLAGLLAQAAAPAGAAGRDSLAVHAPACGSDLLSFSQFVDLLRVELADTRFRCCDVVDGARWPPAPPAVRVDLSVNPCAGATAVAWLEVDDPARRSGAHRGVTIAQLDASTRSRALAMIVAELLRSTEAEAEGHEPQDVVVSVEERAQVDGPRMLAHPGGHPSPRLLAEGELRGYPGAGLVLWGLKAGFSSNVGWRLTLSGDAGAMFGERPYDAGTIRVRAGTTGLSLGPRWNPEHMVTITVGARGEVGWAELSGQPSDTSLIYGASRSSLIAGVAACGTIEGPSRGVVRARLSAQGGAMLRGLVGDIGGSSTTGLSGFYWSVGFALALVPWKRAIE